MIKESTRARIRERIAHGASLRDVDRQLDGMTNLREDERSALWLYAWHCEREPDLDDQPREIEPLLTR